MKKCTYCGTEYPNDSVVCSLDDHELVPSAARTHTASRSSQASRPLIGTAGRWLIFAGVPAAFVALLFVFLQPNHLIERMVGEKALPYVLYFTPGVIVILGKLLYERFPKKAIVPCGILGWFLASVLLCWFFWFGPGALKFGPKI